MHTLLSKRTDKIKARAIPLLLFTIPVVICAVLLKLLNIQPVRSDYDHNWGVLAINTNKSNYLVNEEAHFEFAVLDIRGKMDCDANLTLDIKRDGEIIDSFNTENESIIKNPDCKYKETAEQPDFELNYSFIEAGEYELVLNAETRQGNKESIKHISVVDKRKIDFERKTFTRIFPQREYEVSLIFNPNINFRGEVVEYVPASFYIKKSPLYELLPYSDTQNMLMWNVNWNEGETYILTYVYKAPESSPEFYTLGPVELNKHNNILENLLNLNQKQIFRGNSVWEIAADDLIVHYGATCTGTGPKTFAPDTAAQGSPDLGSAAALSSFTSTNSATADVGDEPNMECTIATARDLGSFTSANIVFSFATEGANNSDDYIDINYNVGVSNYALATIIQDATEKSNNTNGGYWSYAATNITSWTDVTNTIVYFDGIKVLKSDKHNAFVDAVWVEVDYTPRTYTQNDFEWYTPEGTVTLTNIWPTGNGDDLTENEVFTQFPASNEALGFGNQIRLQMNFTVGAANLPTTIEAFKLQYVAADDCTTATEWADVGAKASGTIWRLYDEVSLADAVTQVNQISTSNSGAEGYYSETVNTSDNPSAVNATQSTEWDWPLENNGAVGNTTYCFRMAVDDEVVTFSYNSDSYPKLTTAPGPSNLMRHGNIFQGDLERGYFWAN